MRAILTSYNILTLQGGFNVASIMDIRLGSTSCCGSGIVDGRSGCSTLFQIACIAQAASCVERRSSSSRSRNTSQASDEEGEIHCLNFGISSLSLFTSILSAVGGRIGGSPLHESS